MQACKSEKPASNDNYTHVQQPVQLLALYVPGPLPAHKDGNDWTQAHEDSRPANDSFHHINTGLDALNARGIGNLHMDSD
jgi:hypothetical protein